MNQSTTPPQRIIRTPAEVFEAAAGIPRTIEPWQGEEGPRWRLTISPGSVQIGTKDYCRENATKERAMERRLRENLTVSLSDAPTSTRGKITAWSRESRARMVRRLCTLDYSPLFGEGTTPALVTLTLPHDWETVAGTATQFKTAVDRFRAAYRSVWGDNIRGIWKMEFQYRRACAEQGCHDPRAPHLHILTVIPEGLTKSGVAFPEWLSKAWAQAVRHPDAEQRRLHELAGTGIDFEETLRYGDAKRIAVYFTKHGTFATKEYQNVMPAAWEAAEAGGARFWGYWGLNPAEGVVETDPESAAWVARHLRHLNDAEGRTRDVGVWRSKALPADLAGKTISELTELALIGDRRAARIWPDRAGVLRFWYRRKVRRPVKYMRGTRGFLSVNDGVTTAASIARIVEHYHALRGEGLFARPDEMRQPRPEAPGS